MLVFLDDIHIYNKTIQQHIAHLDVIQEVIKMHQLKDKLFKCNFVVPLVDNLGHVLSSNRVAIDPSEMQEIISL
jgi:hypothetical protein